MNYGVTIGGRVWQIAIEPGNRQGEYTVEAGGIRRVVSASWIDDETLSVLDDGVSRDVRFHRRDAESVGVEVEGALFEAVVAANGPAQGRSKPGARVKPRSAAPGSSHAIKTPMPGRVVRVLVNVADQVRAGDGVVVVEAMKMENELRSPIDGTVTEMRTAADSTVEAGAILMVVAPHDQGPGTTD